MNPFKNFVYFKNRFSWADWENELSCDNNIQSFYSVNDLKRNKLRIYIIFDSESILQF